MKRFELYYPVYPFMVGQTFGENLACINAENKVVAALNNVCPAGYEKLYQKFGLAGHTGLDVACYHGQPIYAAQDGIVEEIQTEPERGLGLGIITEEKWGTFYGEYLVKLRYWHLKGFNVTKGQRVMIGDLIGWADNTGLSSGDHLHFECKPVIKTDTGYINAFQSNGFVGAIDPNPYFVGTAANVFRTALDRIIQSVKNISLLVTLLLRSR